MGLWLALLALALVSGLGSRLQAAPLESEPAPGVAEPEGAPAEDAGAAEEGIPDQAGQHETGEDPVEPDELDGGQVPKPDIKQGGAEDGTPQSTEENKQDRLGPGGPRQGGQQAEQPSTMPLITPLDRGKMLGELYDQLSAAKDLGVARPIMESIDELWRSSGSDTIDLLLSRADRLTKDADLDLATQILDATIDLAPDNAEAWHKRATAEFLRKDYESAIADLSRSLALDPRNYRTLNDLGIVLEQTGAKKEALDAYRKALKANPFLDETRAAVKELTHEVEGQDI